MTNVFHFVNRPNLTKKNIFFQKGDIFFGVETTLLDTNQLLIDNYNIKTGL